MFVGLIDAPLQFLLATVSFIVVHRFIQSFMSGSFARSLLILQQWSLLFPFIPPFYCLSSFRESHFAVAWVWVFGRIAQAFVHALAIFFVSQLPCHLFCDVSSTLLYVYFPHTALADNYPPSTITFDLSLFHFLDNSVIVCEQTHESAGP